jgi:hypothetical protein
MAGLENKFKVKNIPKLVDVVTNTNGTRFYIDEEGGEYLSTTTLLSIYEDTYQLDKWRYAKGAEADEICNFARDVGTLTHKKLEEYLNATLSQNTSILSEEQILEKILLDHAHPDEKYDVLSNKYLNSAINLFFKHVTPIAQEEAVIYNKDGLCWAGRTDQIVYIPAETFYLDGTYNNNIYSFIPEGYYVVDLKTKKNYPPLNTTEKTFKHLIQVSAYTKALESMYEINIIGCIVLYAGRTLAKPIYLSTDLIDWYWDYYELFLLDYYDIEVLETGWSDMIVQSDSCGWIPERIYVNEK